MLNSIKQAFANQTFVMTIFYSPVIVAGVFILIQSYLHLLLPFICAALVVLWMVIDILKTPWNWNEEV